jgi:hypothetical protein
MKFIKLFIVFLCMLGSCQKKTSVEDVPGYKLIGKFSRKIKDETNLVLYSYGINFRLPDGYQLKNGTADFQVSYALYKTQQDSISLDDARALIVDLTESFLREINTNPEIRPYLDFYPFTKDMVTVDIYIKDKNKVDLGNGICQIYYSRGKIEYERYEIYNYTGHYPADGKHFMVHEESYDAALETVKQKGQLTYF